MSQLVIRNHNPEVDYPAVTANLQQAGLYDADRDTEARLNQFADSILVADASGEVVGSVYVVNHIVPMLFGLAVKEEYRRRGSGAMLVADGLKKLADEGA